MGGIVSNPVSDTDTPSVNYGEISIWSFDEIHLFLRPVGVNVIISHSYWQFIQE